MSNPYTKDEINAYRSEPVVVAGTGMFNMRRWLDTVAFLDERGARLTGERDRLSARVAKLEAALGDAQNGLVYARDVASDASNLAWSEGDDLEGDEWGDVETELNAHIKRVSAALEDKS